MKRKSKNCEEYSLILKRLSKCDSPEEARLIHKELKKYGDGMPLLSRYPDLPYTIAIINSVLAVLVSILSIKI